MPRSLGRTGPVLNMLLVFSVVTGLVGLRRVQRQRLRHGAPLRRWRRAAQPAHDARGVRPAGREHGQRVLRARMRHREHARARAPQARSPRALRRRRVPRCGGKPRHVRGPLRAARRTACSTMQGLGPRARMFDLREDCRMSHSREDRRGWRCSRAGGCIIIKVNESFGWKNRSCKLFCRSWLK